MTKKQKNIIKKKKIIVIMGLMLLLLIILAICTTITLVHNHHKNELVSTNENTLYYSEEEKEDDDVLVVNLNESTEKENVSQETNESSTSEQKQRNIPYYIKINNQANVVTVYKKDSKGEYTKAVKAMVCSIGTATPESGVYTISDKYTWRLLQGDVWGQYACRITGHILFHSVPYEAKDKSTLEWTEYDKLGTKASAGCIRLTVADAKWIYDNCVSGTKVEFYSDSNPGPLGKPTAQKISDDTEVRNWDPTDPDSSNPWKTYKKSSSNTSNTSNTSKDSNNQVKTNETTTTTKTNTTNTTNTTKKTNTAKSTNTVK